MINLLKPEKIIIESTSGKPVTYIISRFPATKGFDIVSRLTHILSEGKITQWAIEILSYVATEDNVRLASADIIDNHVDSWEDMGKITKAMVEYNTSFFRNGQVMKFISGLAQNMPRWNSKLLTQCLESLLKQNLPASMSSEQSTT